MKLVMEILKYLIIAAGLMMAYAEMRQAVKLRKASYVWIKWALGFMGLYWAGYYLLSAAGLIIGSTHQVYVRGPLLLTIALVAAGALKSLRRNL